MKTNVVTCKAVSGIYKGEEMKITIGDSVYNSRLEIAGKEITNCYRALIDIGGKDQITVVKLFFHALKTDDE